jgi:hypothetical protein
MTWYLRVKTANEEHILDFGDDKAAADAALEETKGYMRQRHSSPVTIAEQLIVRANSIVSANVYEAL